MKRLLFIAALLLSSFIGFSQSSNFKGTIFEEESDVTIDNALITIEGTTLITKTNDEGEFYFSKTVPTGDQVVTVAKEGFEVKYFMISVEPGKIVNVDRVEVELTSKEKKRRSRLSKDLRKEEKNREKEREDMLKQARKDREKKDKRLAKEKKRLKKKNKDVIISYDEADADTESLTERVGELPEIEADAISPIQTKYAGILGVSSDDITNIQLYEFIDDWFGTPYLLGGANKDGIDCSSFTQRLYVSVYDQYIERTAQKQFDSRFTEKWTGKEYLREGDFLFFKGVGESADQISHVGIYLGNNRFIHSTSRRGQAGVSGVKISDITESFWTSRYVSAGRRINNN